MPERPPAPEPFADPKSAPTSLEDREGSDKDERGGQSQQQEKFIAFQIRCFVLYYTALLVINLIGLGWLWQNAELVQAMATPSWLKELVLPLLTTMLGGAMGNVMYNIRVMYQHYIKRGDYDPKWWGKYFSGPFEAAVLALVVYALLRGGVAAMAGLPMNMEPPTDAMGTTVLAALGLGALVGFSIRDVVGWLQSLSETLFRHDDQS